MDIQIDNKEDACCSNNNGQQHTVSAYSYDYVQFAHALNTGVRTVYTVQPALISFYQVFEDTTIQLSSLKINPEFKSGLI